MCATAANFTQMEKISNQYPETISTMVSEVGYSAVVVVTEKMSCDKILVGSWKFSSIQWSLSPAAWQSKISLLTLTFTKLTDVSRPLSDFTICLWMLFHICAATYKNVLFKFQVK